MSRPLNPEEAQRRRMPRGRPLVWDDADLDRLSRITPEDIDRARAAAPPVARRLLDAEPTDEGRADDER